MPSQSWPALALADWQPTCETLHMWTQIVGKVRLALSPPMNHWWQVPLYVSARGLTTSPIPYGDRTFEILFDFVEHDLYATASDGQRKAMPLVSRPVSDFYAELMKLLAAMGIDVHIWRVPVEVPDPVPFDEDRVHASYDPEYATRFWRVLMESDEVLKEFAGRFQGKQSPVHFFWGSFDLAQSRFSGRRAPERPGVDRITREAYSHEVASFGFWPGRAGVSDAVFYAYAAPEPPGFRETRVRPAAAFYHPQLSEFLLPYESVRQSRSPRETLLDFCQSTYDAAATLGGWDRASLDREPKAAPVGPGASEHPPEHPATPAT